MFDDHNRPRIGLALAVTAIALVAWLVTRDGQDDGEEAATPPVATAINGVPLDPPIGDASEAAAAADAAPTTADEPSRPRVEAPDDVPVFMDGDPPSSTVAVPQIAVPEEPAIAPLRRSASFRSTINGFRTCLVRELDSGLTVTITNLDNGREITCVTSLAPADQIDEVVLHTRLFRQIADLTEAPITVEVAR
ncbi:MAG: hypothetical protein AAFP84_11535 [Actinomycetota bacterium]